MDLYNIIMSMEKVMVYGFFPVWDLEELVTQQLFFKAQILKYLIHGYL